MNGANRRTKFIDETRLAVTLMPEDVAVEGTLELVVANPPPGGGASAVLPLRVAAATATPAATRSAALDEQADGCDVEIVEATPDEALPAARGGVSTS